VKVILADEVLEVRAKDKRMLIPRRPKFPKDDDDGLLDPIFPV
jgi:hypothetical protein